ncbi:hypothetical protein D3C86_2075050 [compost metagenome]
MPGISSGMSPTIWRTLAISLGNVAPTTSPICPLVFQRSRAASATSWYSGLPSTCRNCTSEPPGLEVRHSTITPRFG